MTKKFEKQPPGDVRAFEVGGNLLWPNMALSEFFVVLALCRRPGDSFILPVLPHLDRAIGRSICSAVTIGPAKGSIERAPGRIVSVSHASQSRPRNLWGTARGADEAGVDGVDDCGFVADGSSAIRRWVDGSGTAHLGLFVAIPRIGR